MSHTKRRGAVPRSPTSPGATTSPGGFHAGGSLRPDPVAAPFDGTQRRNYDELMTRVKKGIPVWKLDPSSSTNSAQIGDVGYWRNGDFHRLFNVIDDKLVDGVKLEKYRWEPPIVSDKVKCTLGRLSVAGTLETSQSNAPNKSERMDVAKKQDAGGKRDATGSKKQSDEQSMTFTVDASVDSGAILFPVSPLRLEYVEDAAKKKLWKCMKDNLGSWPCPESVARKDLLLVHSRLVAEKWVMMTFNISPLNPSKSEVRFFVTIDVKGWPSLDPNGVTFLDHAFKRSPAIMDMLPNVVANPSILFSHCAFLGAFVPKVARLLSWDVEDTAPDLKPLADK